MVEIKEIIAEIDTDESLKNLKITTFIKDLETENYGITENNNFLSNKLTIILEKYMTNGKDTKD